MTKEQLLTGDCDLLAARDVAITSYLLLPPGSKGRRLAASEIDDIAAKLRNRHYLRRRMMIEFEACDCKHRDLPAKLVAARAFKQAAAKK